jgi:small subunit ribosomal protein S16
VAVKLRLVRMGKKKQPTYRLVAADSRSPRDGRFLEVLGTYEPRGASRAQPETVLKVDNDKAVQWLQRGAQPTERVEKLLKASGAWATYTGTAGAEPAAAQPPAPAAPAAEPASPAPVAATADDGSAEA